MTKNYNIISNLTGEDFKKVRSIQKDISQITGSKKCLVDWLPHITIGDSPLLSEEELVEYENKLMDFLQKVILLLLLKYIYCFS